VRDTGAIPTPLGAASLTLFAWAITLFGTGLAEDAHGWTSLAIGLCLGFGGVGTMAARSVPAPAEIRIGLHGFAPRLLLPILLMAPVILLASEVDNRVPALATPLLNEATTEAVEIDPEVARLAALEMLITLVLLRPVLEEFFFRGVIQQGLVAHLGALGGVLQTALLSGVATGGIFLFVEPSVAASEGARTLVLALVFGLVRFASGSLLAAIVAAVGYGLLGVAMTPLGIPGFTPGVGDHTPLWILVPCALSVAAGAWLALRWRVDEATPPATSAPLAS
jgi:membrane protease YdiL (CAAX protease family)